MNVEEEEQIIRKINRNYQMPQCDYWILDTDVGADDAQAIVAMIYLAKKYNKTILGITAVNGNGYVEDVVKNILITLAVCQAKIPVYKGAGQSFLGEDLKDHFFGKDAFGEKQKLYLEDFKEKIDFSLNKDQAASLFIVEAAEKYAGNIGIIALGPLTNLAMAYLLDPSVADNVNMVTMMGGNYSTFGMNDYFGCQFNFRLDPEAARIVVKRFKNIFCTTIQVPFDFPEGICQKVFKKQTTQKAKLIKDLYENIYQDFGGAFVCDPLAVFAALSPRQTLLGTYQAQGTVYLRGARTRGMLCMNWLGAQGKGVNICLEWDMKRVLQEIEQSYKMKFDFEQ